MRIYGGTDYYDAVQALGTDKSVVLSRTNELIEPCGGVFIPSHTLHIQGRQGTFGILRFINVVFGPKIYHGLHINDYMAVPGQEYFFWDAHKLREWLAAQDSRKELKAVVARPWNQKTETPLEEFFKVEDSPRELFNYMVANRYAILLEIAQGRGYKNPEYRVNPPDLKKYGFAKALDPYTAYQELSMWVGGVLCGQSPAVVEITDDKTILEGHGFDNKISFRGPRV
jgi:hypothetical protein